MNSIGCGWFKETRFFFLLEPVSWQGWSVVGLFAAIAVWNFFRLDMYSHSASDTLVNFVPETVFLIFIYILASHILCGSLDHIDASNEEEGA